MDKLKRRWEAHKPTKRRLLQVYAALLYNAHVEGFLEGDLYTGTLKNLCVPGLNCYSCPGAVGACPLGALQNALASSGSRAPFYVLGCLLLFGLILGRMICGWLCPMGLLQELLHKLPTPKIRKCRVTRALCLLKYALLAIFVVLIPLHYAFRLLPLPAFCKYICPAGTLEGAVALLSNPVNASKFSMLNLLFTRKFILLVLLAALCVFAFRAFCRFFCPLGAIYGLFAKVSLLGVKVSPARCTHCSRCVQACSMDIRRVGDHECIHCGACISVCAAGAISWKGGRLLLRQNEVIKEVPTVHATDARNPRNKLKTRSLTAWAAALIFLAGTLWFVNRPAEVQAADEIDASVAEVSANEEASVGTEPGMLAPGFTVPLYAGGDFVLQETRGKVVIINFWATWCMPCIEELPYFQEIYEQYPDDVVIVALHSSMVTEDVQAWLSKQRWTLPFALDTDGSVMRSLGGSTTYPMTVVLDREGRIVYNKEGSVTLALLESLIAPLL